LRTHSTTGALESAKGLNLLKADDCDTLEAAWSLASRIRSANVLANDRQSDMLPTDRRQLEGIARMLEYEPGSASVLEEEYLAATRRARAVYERVFLET
jgi:glutamate-ammonia-ligase adenylyltransferase